MSLRWTLRRSFLSLLGVLVCIVLAGTAPAVHAQDSTTVDVTGAGSSVVNGSYTCEMNFGACENFFGHTKYVKDSNSDITIEWNSLSFRWEIREGAASLGTTYYTNGTDQFRPPVNGWQTAFGGTGDPPSLSYGPSQDTLAAYTRAATFVTSTGAQLNGAVNPADSSTTVEFVFGPVGSGTRSRAEAQQSPVNDSTTVSLSLGGLSPATEYEFYVKATRGGSTDRGDTRTFTTDAGAPTASTDAATQVTDDGAGLNATVNPRGAPTTVQFEYYPTANPGNVQTVTGPQNLTGSSAQSVSVAVSGLSPGTEYAFRVVASNREGTDQGNYERFTTTVLDPTATTDSTENVTTQRAELFGTVNANGVSTTVEFEYFPSGSPGSAQTVPASQSPVSGTDPTVVSAPIDGLSPGTEYAFRVRASNGEGTADGSTKTFTTGAPPTLSFSPNGLSATLSAGETNSVSLTISNTGDPSSTLDYSFPGFAGQETPPSFIEAVSPASGTVGQGESETVTVTFDATGEKFGTVTDELSLRSNDPTTPSTTVPLSLTVEPARQTATSAITLDGTDDYVGTPLDIDQSSSSDGATFEAWVYPTRTSSGRHHVLSSNGGGFEWSLLREGGEWYVFTGADSKPTGFSVDTDTWQHLAAVFDPSDGAVRVYKNGRETVVPSIDTDTDDATVSLGRQKNAGGGQYFGGRIDEVRIWNGTRTKQQIRDDRIGTLRGDESNLLAYWPLEAGGGTSAADAAGGGNTATLRNGTGWTANDAPVSDTDPAFTVPVDTSAVAGRPYQAEVRAADPNNAKNTLTLSATTPNWLSFADSSDGTGTLTGIPPSGGTYRVDLTVTDPDGNATTQSITIDAQTNYALTYDGTDDNVAVPDAPEINTDRRGQRTIEAWFKVEDATVGSRRQVIYEEGGRSSGFNLYVYAGALYVGAWNEDDGWNGTWLQTGAVQSGRWHHVALIYDESAGSVRGVLDGVEFGRGNAPVAMASHDGDIGVGAVRNHSKFEGRGDFRGDGQEFGGTIDGLRIWNRARSTSAIRTSRFAPLAGEEDDLAAYWRFNEGSGTTAADATGNGNDGTVNGATWTTVQLPDGRTPFFTFVPDTTAVTGKSYQIGVSAQDPDAPNSALTLQASTAPGWLSLTDDGDGTGTLSGTPSSAGTYDVRLDASDGDGNTASRSFTVTVGDGFALDVNSGASSYAAHDGVSNFPGTGLTASFWAKTGATEAGFVSYATSGQADEFLIAKEEDDLNVSVAGNRVRAKGVLPSDGAWHHVAVTWAPSSGEANIYVDGSLRYTESVASGQTLSTGGVLVLGQDQGNRGGGFDADRALDGQIDEVQLWSRALTPLEVLRARRTPPPSQASGLVSYYDLDGDGTDATGSNPLTLVGGAEFNTPQAPYASVLDPVPGGTYTIGGTSPDYADLSAAISDLQTRGINGAVALEVTDGTYQESLTIGPIGGASASNTVTIRSASGDSSAVTLEASGASGSEPLRLNGADHLRIERLTLKATASSGNARAAYLRSRVENVQFTGVQFLSYRDNDRRGQVGLYAENNTITTDLVVEDSRFGTSTSGLYLRGDRQSPSTGTTIRGNVVGDSEGGPKQQGIVLNHHDGPQVTQNVVSGTGGRGIELSQTNGAFRVTKNALDVDGPGIDLDDSDGASSSAKGRVANNEITSSHGNGPGFRLAESGQVQVLHNSVHMTAGGRAFRGERSGGSVVQNNIFASEDGPVIEAINVGFSLDYNGLYTTGPVLVDLENTTYADLSAYRSGTSQGANSIVADPAFASPTDLTPASPFFDDEGTDLTGTVADDIEGTSRNASPSLGAVEYTAPNPPLAGIYTVGGSGPDYPDLSAAVSDLQTRGISGAVALEVADGTYQESVTVGPIGGASSSNTITFSSASDNASAVVLEASGASGSEPLRLNGADHLRVERLTLKATASSGDARAAYLRSRVEDVQFASVRFLSRRDNDGKGQVGLYAENNSVTTDLVVEDSRFGTSTSGLYLRGDRHSPSTGTVVRKNVFGTQSLGAPRRRGIYLGHHKGATVTENTVSGTSTQGIELAQSNGAFRVTQNDLDVDGPGIDLDDSDGASSSARGLVANNEITSSDGSEPGLRLAESGQVQVLHNSVHMTAGGRAFRGDRSGGSVVQNNIFASEGGETIRATNVGFSLDYNGLYTTGPVLIDFENATYADLSAYRSGASQGANSVVANPAFASPTDLTPSSPFLDDAGTDVSTIVTEDIAGTTRAGTPSLGAVEYTASRAPLASGTYTVGGSGPDYSDLSSAVAALQSRGVDGAVTFELRDGTYAESTTIGPVAGASASNTITFRSASNDISAVTLAASGAAGSEPLRINGADHIRVERLTLKATASSGDARAAYLRSRVEDVQFTSVQFLSRRDNDGKGQVGLYAENNTVTTDLVVEDSRFGASTSGLYLRGDGQAPSTGTVVRNSVFGDSRGGPKRRGVFLGNHDGAQVTQNAVLGTNNRGIELRDSNGAIEVTQNDLDVTGRGIELDESDGTSGAKGLVANNEITASEENAQGLRIIRSAHQQVFHNTVNVTNGETALQANGGGASGTVIQNNIFAATGGKALRVDNSSGLTFDYNGLYATGAALVSFDRTDYPDLASYRSGTGQGANAVAADPAFASDTDLTPSTSEMANAGADLTSVVPNDIEGRARDDTPSLGALEFTGSTSRIVFRLDTRRLERLGLLRRSKDHVPFVRVFDGFLPTVRFLEDPNQDSTWTGRVLLKKGQTVSYAFGLDVDGTQNSTGDRILELTGEASGARTLTVPQSNETLSVATFDEQPLASLPGTPAAQVTRSFRSGDPSSTAFRNTDPDTARTFVTLDYTSLDRPAVTSVRRDTTNPGGSTPSTIEVIASQGHWHLRQAPAQASFTTDVTISYANLTGIAAPSALRLLRREDASSAWQVVTTNLNTNRQTLTATDVSTFSQWTIGSTSPQNQLTVKRPSGVSSPTPESGSGGVSRRPTLAWQPADNAGSYNVFLWPASASPPSQPTATGLTSTEFGPERLEPAQTYKWQVAAQNAYGSRKGPIWTFTTKDEPDLVASNVSTESSITGGESVQVSWTVQNSGKGGTSGSSWKDRIYLSSDQQLDDSDRRIATYEAKYPLGAGEQYTQTPDVDIPLKVSGTFYVLVDADGGVGDITETNENNNAASSASTLNVKPVDLADLKVTSMRATPDPVFSGDSVHVSWKVKNKGEGPTQEADQWRDVVYFTDDLSDVSVQTIIGDDKVSYGLREARSVTNEEYEVRRLGQIAEGDVEPDSSYERTSSFALDVDQGSGKYYTIVLADAGNKLTEGSDVDTKVDSFEVKLRPPPDLTASTPSVPATATAGQDLSASWTLENQGTGSVPSRQSNWTDRVYVSKSSTFDRGQATLLAGITQNTELASGGTASVSAQASLPLDLSGAYYVYVDTDAGGDVYEGNSEDNNLVRSSGTVQIQVPPSPDLTVTSVSAQSAQVEAGNKVQLSWTVKNGGDAAAEPDWNDRIFLSSTSTWDASAAQQLTGVRRSSALVQDDKYTRSAQVRIPADVSGTQYLYVQTDGRDAVFEFQANDNNRGRSGSVQVGAYPPIDLAATSLNVTPTTVTAGDDVTVEWSVRNQGTGTPTASDWFDRVYISPDQEIDPDQDPRLAFSSYREGLAPDSSYAAQATATIPPSLKGTYYLLLDQDSNNDVNDADPSNNTANTPISINVRETNLIVESTSVSRDPVDVGATVQVQWTVKNKGSTVTNVDQWFDLVHLSSSSTKDERVSTVPVNRESVLRPGKTYSVTKDVTMPSRLSSGTYYVIAETDGRDQVYERNGEFDNTASASVTVEQPPPSNLTVSNVQVPKEASPGDSVEVSYTLKNTGPKTISGTITDAAYFSSDQTLDSTDVVLGTRRHAVNLTSGATTTVNYTTTAAPSGDTTRTRQARKASSAGEAIGGSTPDLSPGDYHGIVSVDLGGQIRETDNADNEAASTGTTSLSVVKQDVGAIAQRFTAYSTGARQYRKIEVTDQRDNLRVRLSSVQSQDSYAELYVRRGAIPTRAAFDVAADASFESEQTIKLTDATPGTYYVMAYVTQIAGKSETFDLKTETLDFSVDEISTMAGGNEGVTTTIIQGALFDDGAKAYLRDAQGNRIQAAETQVRSSDVLAARFDLRGKSTGLRDVVVENPSGATRELKGAFDVVEGQGADPFVRIPSTAIARGGEPINISLTMGNRGTSNAYDHMLVIVARGPTECPSNLVPNLGGGALVGSGGAVVKSRASGKASVNTPSWFDESVAEKSDQFTTTFPRPDSLSDTRRFDLVQAPTKDPSKTMMAGVFWVPELAPGTEQTRTVTIPSFDAFSTCFGYGAQLVRMPRSKFTRTGTFSTLESAAGYDFVVDAMVESWDEALDQTAGGAKNLAKNGDNPLQQANQEVAKDFLDPIWSALSPVLSVAAIIGAFMLFGPTGVLAAEIALQAYTGNGLRKTAQKVFEGYFSLLDLILSESAGAAGHVFSVDPNDILGPAGIGDKKWVGASTPLSYTVRFENDPERATAPARQVRITHPLDASVDPQTFQLGSFGFAGLEFDPPPNRSFYQERLDVRDSLDVAVNVTAGVDVAKREAFWIFEAVDPTTGLPPSDPFTGMLPVNDSTGRGEGFAKYSIQAAPSAQTGDTIRAEAEIIFDDNEPIETPPVTNTLDASAPTSAVKTLPQAADTTDLLVKWTQRDTSGVGTLQATTLYVSKDDGPFEVYEEGIQDTSIVFQGERGHDYAFLARAEDQTGNVEPLSSKAEATTTLGQRVSVWPGDTNNDGTVDQGDVLPIGQYFGLTGPSRSPVSSFSAATVAPWAPKPATYADANGDGDVDQGDVLPIGQFFGLTHSKQKAQATAGEEPLASLHVRPLPEGTMVPVYVRVGTEERPADDVLGVSAGLQVPSETFAVQSVEPTEALGMDLVSFHHHEEKTGTIGLGYTRRQSAGAAPPLAGAKVAKVVLKVTGSMDAYADIRLQEARTTTPDPSSEVKSGGDRVRLTSPKSTEVPGSYTLKQNYPNPTRHRTTIRFALPERRAVTLEVYDLLGRRVAVLKRDEKMKTGWHAVQVDASRLASGAYFYRLRAGDFRETKKMVVVK